MKTVPTGKRDRRRSQRGSVLSAVLIITAFLAIIAGALMTELSTNLLVSRVLVHRVVNEATVNSAVELAIDQLQSTPVGQPCPVPGSPTLNSLTATATYASCFTTSDSGPARIAGSSAFTVDGARVTIGTSGWNVDEYLVADSTNLYEFNFGSASPNYSFSLGGSVTGPAAAVPDVAAGAPNLLDLVPMGSNCGSTTNCVAVLTESAGDTPAQRCVMPSEDTVTASPAAGIRNPSIAFFGDASGNLYAYSPGTTGDADCTLTDQATLTGGMPIVAGPFVFPGGGGTDEIYVVASNGSASEIVRYSYNGGSLSYHSTRTLPFANVTGVAADGRTLPALLAIDYSGGQLTLAQIGSSYGVTLSGSTSVAATLAAAPGWCQCAGSKLIGIGGVNGGIYVFDTGLNLITSYSGGPAIATAPTGDPAGEWFYGASDGYLHELVQPPGQSNLVQAGAYGPLDGQTASSPVAGACPNGFCVYLATSNRSAYLTTLDSRNVVLTACLSAAPPACSGVNPRLWTRVQIGSMGNPRTVSVTGWSYYSP